MNYDVAEQIFIDEICDKHQTEDIDVAETMFYADVEDEDAQINM